MVLFFLDDYTIILKILQGARRPSHYLMGALKNGRLQVVFKGRKKIELAPQAVCNDGIWHKVKYKFILF